MSPALLSCTPFPPCCPAHKTLSYAHKTTPLPPWCPAALSCTHNILHTQPTPEVAVFDLLGIPLVHGWLVDPQDATTTAVFSNKSYNELVEMLFLVSRV